MKTIENVQYGNCEINKLDIYLPKNDGFDTIVYFHGGGLESGDKKDENYLGMAQSFVEKGYAFISVNYHLYPTAKFPKYLEDCAKAVAWVKANIKEYGGNGNLYISGQSAGAWISLMLCLNEQYLKNVEVSPMEITGWIIDSAQTTSHFNVLKYEAGCNPCVQRIDEYAPLYYVNENTKFTKMLVLFYEEDMPCRPEQNMLFIKAVREFNRGANLQYKQLKGGHCHGSSFRDEDGEYDYVKESIRWLKNG
jgi:acetyl esterase/lipase